MESENIKWNEILKGIYQTGASLRLRLRLEENGRVIERKIYIISLLEKYTKCKNIGLK